MTTPTRILLVTPHDVVVEPTTDQIEVRLEPVHWTNVASDLSQYTHLAVGPASGSVRSAELVRAANSHSNQTANVLPLHGYKWIGLLSDSRLLLSMLEGVANGAMVIAPVDSVRIPVEPTWLTEAGYKPVGSLLSYLPPGVRIRIADVKLPVAAAGQPFELLPLVPDRLAEVASAGESAKRGADMLSQHFDRDRAALLAGYFQISNMLDASHNLAQSIEGRPDGDYWHAIMHRREPDYGNSKYWYRHVGRHPVFAQLAPRTVEILNAAPADIRAAWAPKLKADSAWDPFAFVDMCEAAARDENSPLGLTARRIQWLEMLLLMKHCAR